VSERNAARRSELAQERMRSIEKDSLRLQVLLSSLALLVQKYFLLLQYKRTERSAFRTALWRWRRSTTRPEEYASNIMALEEDYY
jgi:hypothetical protein